MEHILIIEDEAVIRKALAKLLKRAGYKVSEAGSVAESEKQYSLDTFHLIIADLRLPGGLGTEVIEKCAGTPVLIMTSYASIGSAVDAMKAGAADYISKPFNHDEILVVIDRLIRQNLLFRQTRRCDVIFSASTRPAASSVHPTAYSRYSPSSIR